MRRLLGDRQQFKRLRVSVTARRLQAADTACLGKAFEALYSAKNREQPVGHGPPSILNTGMGEQIPGANSSACA
jgi:hypothetical protein